MVKVRNIDDILDRYAESALISAIRLRRYWLSQGMSEEKAVERGVNQALGMLAASGVPRKRLIELFEELNTVSEIFVNVIKKSPSKNR